MPNNDYDVVIVGAGFAGLYMLHKARTLGLSAQVLEAAGGVGGTWYYNRYPGARCDVESMEYSYQFSHELQQEWNWSEVYSPQEEILCYANHVADRFDLRRDIRFNTRVKAATFDDTTSRWTLETENGTRVTGKHCVMGTGCLSTTNTPFEGVESFEGATYHTGNWPHEKVDFTGLRVGVIGTGSSAIQAIPMLAQEAQQLYVFQRTPNYTVPARNRALTPDVCDPVKADYAGFRARAKTMASGILYEFNPKSALEVSPEERQREYEKRWRDGGVTFMGAFADLVASHESNETAAEFVRGKIREIVKDTKVAELLSPKNVIGCKRLCVDTDYWETFNRPNVTLVDVSKKQIEKITQKGVKTGGKEYELDALVFATGFDAMTGTLLAMDIRGRNGAKLREKWAEVPYNYLGLTVAGFPNFFTVTGPGSPSVFANMMNAIEQHVDWIGDCMTFMEKKGIKQIEPKPDAEAEWVEHVSTVGAISLRSHCDSWYLGSNIAGKPRVFSPYIGPVPDYTKKCEDVATQGYEGFILR